MFYDFSELPAPNRYKLLAGTVTPRPIAWVTTQDADGLVNAAPYSFFNAMGHTPPTVVLGLLHDPKTGAKDTETHILATQEFVVNLVNETVAEAMNGTAINAPRSVSEIARAGIETVPATRVAPPLIAAAPVSFECRLLQAVQPSTESTIVIGEVLAAHIEERFILDAERCHIDTPAMGMIGRMHGAGYYARTSDLFTMARPVWEEK